MKLTFADQPSLQKDHLDAYKPKPEIKVCIRSGVVYGVVYVVAVVCGVVYVFAVLCSVVRGVVLCGVVWCVVRCVVCGVVLCVHGVVWCGVVCIR